MKASDKPQFSKKWWNSNRPPDLTRVDLDKELAAVEKALADEQKKTTPQSVDSCSAALLKLSAAVDKAITACDKKKHKDVISVLKRFDPLIKTELARLSQTKRQAAATSSDRSGDDDEDETDEKLFDQDYLYKMMKLLKSTDKELRFGFGLNSTTPDASRLLLKRKGTPEILFKLLKKTKEFSNRTLTYGYAKADPEDGQTLVFRLETGANEPPQLLKLGRKFLRSDKKLRFRKLKIVLPGGKTLVDNEPDDADDVDATTRAVDNAEQIASRTRKPARDAIIRASAAEPSPQTEVIIDLRAQFKQARREWVTVRDQVQRDLEVIKTAVLEQYLDDSEQWPLVTKGIKQLDDIMDNLNDDLRNALDTYIATPVGNVVKRKDAAAKAQQLMDVYRDYIRSSDLVAAVDRKEFADVVIGQPIERALRNLSQTLF